MNRSCENCGNRYQLCCNYCENLEGWKPMEQREKVRDKGVKHSEICNELNRIYVKKNHDYNDSFSKTFEEYGLVMSAIRLEDKLTRFKQLIKNEAKVNDESLEDTLKDMANYAIMTLIELNSK